MIYNFNVEKVTKEIIDWIRCWFIENGDGCNAVIGISGGKDSTVVAKLCVEALGADRVIGVMMPCGVQKDISDSIRVCEYLGIKNYTINIEDAVNATLKQMEDVGIDISEQTRVNLPPRIRMSTLYAVSQSVNGRVVNTCNLSEDWVGYSTRYGASVGDFSPLSMLCVREVKAIGRYLGLPEDLIEKVPIDGLCGQTDEEKLGFTYEMLDRYIREGICEDAEKKAKIDRLYAINRFKVRFMDVFPYDPE